MSDRHFPKNNILFITSTRLGDAVLSMGILDHVLKTVPNPSVTIACGKLPSSLFEGVPYLNRVITLSKKKYHGHWFDLWKQTVSTRWHTVIDLRNSAVSRALWAKHRYIHGPQINQQLHKVQQHAQLLGLDINTPPAPRLFATWEQQEKARGLIPEGPHVLGIGPTANWIGKTWPVENFIALVKILTASDGIMPNARVAVFAAPNEEEDAIKLLQTIPESQRIDMIAKGDPGTVAAALSRCSLYVGNDSGLMHCAAAAQVPTFGLFGPSYPHLYAPWGAHAAWIATPKTFDELIDFEGYHPKTLKHSLMHELTTDDVVKALKEFYLNTTA